MSDLETCSFDYIPHECDHTENEKPTYDGREYELGELNFRGEERYHLYGADPNCIHKIETQWSGYKCVKCEGWYCA